MNQYIQINYKPDWSLNPNFWKFWFGLNFQEYREKAPSWLNSIGYWEWQIQNKFKKCGYDFDWKNL